MDGESHKKSETGDAQRKESSRVIETGIKYVIPFKDAPRKFHGRLKNKHDGFDRFCLACSKGVKESGVKFHVKSDSHFIAVEDYEVDKKLNKINPPSVDHITCLNECVLRTSQKHSAALNEQICVRRDIAQELQTLLVHLNLPEVEMNVGLHGSSLSELGLVTSDVNLNLIIPGCDMHKERPAQVMKLLVKLLEEQDTVKKVKADFYSFNKIPRILYEHKKSKLKCEVRVNVGSPKSLSLLLYCYYRLDPRVLQLGVTFRFWAKLCCVDSQISGHYPGHLFYIMTIHFLQQRNPPVIPVLHERLPILLKHEELSEDEVSGGFLTEQIIREVLDSLKTWQCSNSEPVGLLWHDMLKYYAVDLETDKHAVSILQHELIKREETQWGNSRLAVEDPSIPRSNVARAASSDRVYEYLRLCLKKTLVYFNFYNPTSVNQQSDDTPSGVGSPSIGLEDESIVFASTTCPTPSLLGEPPLPEVEGVDYSACLPHLDHTSEAVQTAGKNTTVEDDLAKEVDCLSIGNSIEHQGQASSSSPPILSTPIQSHKESPLGISNKAKTVKVIDAVKFKFDFVKDKFAHQQYPVTCLACKKLRHIILNCPIDELPRWDLSIVKIPPKEYLGIIKDIFRKYRKQVSPRADEVKVRKDICLMISEVIKEILPDSECELFGSSANGFGTAYSDLDICLKLPYNKIQLMSKSEKNELIEEVAKLLSHNREFQKICPITSARVPIVKFYVPYYRQECDVSLCNYLALRNTKMIKAYSALDDRARLLGYAVKYFAKICDMGDASTGSLSSYAYILLVIHYLQRTDPPVLPCLQKIFPPNHEPMTIDHWDCYFFEDFENFSKYWHSNRNTESAGQLWLGFLKYFLQFDWAKEVVTIRQLDPLYKIDKWWMGKHMCIEDPFDLDHNLATSIGPKMRTYILERFYSALVFNCNKFDWKHIDNLLDPKYVVGDNHAPKFLMCHLCGRRGHKSDFCPDKKMKKSGKGSKPHKEKMSSTQSLPSPHHSRDNAVSSEAQLRLTQHSTSLLGTSPQPTPITGPPHPTSLLGTSQPASITGPPHPTMMNVISQHSVKREEALPHPTGYMNPISQQSVFRREEASPMVISPPPTMPLQIRPQVPGISTDLIRLHESTVQASEVLPVRPTRDGYGAGLPSSTGTPNMIRQNYQIPGYPSGAIRQTGIPLSPPPSSPQYVNRPVSSVGVVQPGLEMRVNQATYSPLGQFDRPLPSIQPSRVQKKTVIYPPHHSAGAVPATTSVVNHPMYSQHQQPFNYPMYSQHQQPLNHPMYSEHQQPLNHPMYSQHQQPLNRPVYSQHQQPLNRPMYSQHQQPLNRPMYSQHQQPLNHPSLAKQTAPSFGTPQLPIERPMGPPRQ